MKVKSVALNYPKGLVTYNVFRKEVSPFFKFFPCFENIVIYSKLQKYCVTQCVTLISDLHQNYFKRFSIVEN